MASAFIEENKLRAVLYPGLEDGIHDISVGGLRPEGRYCIQGALSTNVMANHDGKAVFKIMLTGRTCFLFYAEGEV